jgi:hypothetical protein
VRTSAPPRQVPPRQVPPPSRQVAPTLPGGYSAGTPEKEAVPSPGKVTLPSPVESTALPLQHDTVNLPRVVIPPLPGQCMASVAASTQEYDAVILPRRSKRARAKRA